MMQKQEASIETHNEHNQSFMIFIELLKSAKDITRRLAVLKKKQ